jgi:hypothetical protein
MKHQLKRIRGGTHALLMRTAAGGAIAAAMATHGLLGITAATANALPISQLQSECRGAGGTWAVDYQYSGSTNVRYVSGYQCFYKDNEGNGYVDFYDRKGNYKGSG